MQPNKDCKDAATDSEIHCTSGNARIARRGASEERPNTRTPECRRCKQKKTAAAPRPIVAWSAARDLLLGAKDLINRRYHRKWTTRIQAAIVPTVPSQAASKDHSMLSILPLSESEERKSYRARPASHGEIRW
jgi:hypothetical protein